MMTAIANSAIFVSVLKICPQCNAENDIAARRCRECDAVLVDPDDMLKAALRLKDALVLRCSGMVLQNGQDDKGEWLKIHLLR